MASLQTGIMKEAVDSGKQLSIDTRAPKMDPMHASSPSDYSPSSSPIYQSSNSMKPSKPALETPIATHPFNYPQPSPPPSQPLPHLPSIDSVRTDHNRGLSLASNTSSVKRKPLPINAKPLAQSQPTAIRYSTDYESSRGSFETPGPRFYRNPSIDSPTLWEAGLFKDQEQEPEGRQRSPM